MIQMGRSLISVELAVCSVSLYVCCNISRLRSTAVVDSPASHDSILDFVLTGLEPLCFLCLQVNILVPPMICTNEETFQIP